MNAKFSFAISGLLATNSNGVTGYFKSDHQDKEDPRPYLSTILTGGLVGYTKTGGELAGKAWNLNEQVMPVNHVYFRMINIQDL